MDSEAVIVVRDMEESKRLADYILGNKTQLQFETEFKGKYTEGFEVAKHFQKIGVINQTTMLATETEEIASFFKSVLIKKFGEQNIKNHFSDTNDTLCYATNENQDACYGLLETDADLAIVIGGYNSSNTSHLVELCEKKFPTYFISSEQEIESNVTIHHFDYPNKKMVTTNNFLGKNNDLKIIITSGASCPDSLLDQVINKLNKLVGNTKNTEDVLIALKTFNN
jgi:4-hydroxy-3-methylbut-2-enyl diphosphate reductase